jgi:hypothetical protein
MAARVPSVLNAAIELSFVAVAGLLGFLRAPIWAPLALTAAMIAYWGINRRTGLKQLAALGAVRLAGATALTLILVCAVLGAAFWLGGLLSGRLT